MIKKILSLSLCLIMFLPLLASCQDKLDPEEKGAIIPIYLTGEIYNFDPALAFTNDQAAKILGLLYEPLMKVNEKGELTKALLKEYSIITDSAKGEYKMLITLANSCWSDGRYVSANDFVYAWKRILEPDFTSGACALLFDIKNARSVKEGDMTIDDLGLAAVDELVIEIQFEREIDYNQFLLNLSSIALVPLREDIVTRNPVDWAKKVTTIVTNGPFQLKNLDHGYKLALERSRYYYIDPDKEEAVNKYVNPYRLEMFFEGGVAQRLAEFNDGTIFYLGEIPLGSRDEYKNKATVTDLPSTHSYFFNTNNTLFKNPEVRRALSVAIDRAKLAETIVFAKPASGIVPEKVFDVNKANKSFRSAGGELIPSSGDVSKAKQMLSAAGVNPASQSFTITHRNDEIDRAIAEYVSGVWQELGFKVSLRELSTTKHAGGDTAILDDAFQAAYVSGDFDVIAVDMQALSADAFSVLAPFAKSFSGTGMNMTTGEFKLEPHISGFDNDAYNELIESAFVETDLTKRAELLHQAEEMLAEEMPVMPLIFNQDAYLISGELSGNASSWYGWRDFNKMKLKDFRKYLETEPVEDAVN